MQKRGEKFEYFERVLSFKGEIRKVTLSQDDIDTSLARLCQNDHLMTLVRKYREGLNQTDGLSENDEVALRQKIFPVIDAQLQGIDPTYQIFSAGILELLFEHLKEQAS